MSTFEKIDKALNLYYRALGHYDYYDDNDDQGNDNQGKFLEFCEENGLDEEEQKLVIFNILKSCYQTGKPPDKYRPRKKNLTHKRNIDCKTYLSVLFTLSPSVNNAKATESTLKFAVTAGMVKVKPIATKGKVNFKTLAAELRAHIEKQVYIHIYISIHPCTLNICHICPSTQEQVIDDNNRQIENIMRMQNKIKFEIDQKKNGGGGGGGGGIDGDEQKLPDGIQKETRTKKVINDDGDEEEIVEDYYVDVDGNEVEAPPEIAVGGDGVTGAGGYEPATPAQLDEETSAEVQQLLSGLNDTEQEFMKGLGNEFLEQMAEDGLKSDPNATGAGGRARTVTAEENDEALKLAMEQYAKLTIPWKKEQLLVKTKRDLAKKKKAREQQREKEEQEQKMREIEEQIRKSEEEFNKLQEKQKEVAAKLSDPNYTPQKEELSEHAMTLSIMLAEQKAMTEALEQSKAVMIDFLKSDGREALVAFFKIKGGL